MTDPFLNYASGFESLLASGQHLRAPGEASAPVLPAVAEDAPVCLIFSPHPDDEAITGGLPWRLRRESGWRVINVAVTLGSNPARRDARWLELAACCKFLGFELVSASGESRRGLERIVPLTVQQDATYWADSVAKLAALVQRYQPRVIVCPHDNDGHASHIGTYLLVMDALRLLGSAAPVEVVLGEYWNTQADPGLMVQLGAGEVATLISALSLHVGEVARNPYHLTLPAWWMDGVRRGAERVGAPGSAAPAFSFAALYGWKRWSGERLVARPAQPLALDTPAGRLFE